MAMARNCKCCEWSELTSEDTVGEETLILLLPAPLAVAGPGENMERIFSTDATCLIELTTLLRLSPSPDVSPSSLNRALILLTEVFFSESTTLQKDSSHSLSLSPADLLARVIMAGESFSLSLSWARGAGLDLVLDDFGLDDLRGVMGVRVATCPRFLTEIGEELSVELLVIESFRGRIALSW